MKIFIVFKFNLKMYDDSSKMIYIKTIYLNRKKFILVSQLLCFFNDKFD